MTPANLTTVPAAMLTHFLPGKEYTYFTLKPLGEEASRGQLKNLKVELAAMNKNIESSELYRSFLRRYIDREDPSVENMNALKVSCLAERALCYLYAEQNLVSAEQVLSLAKELSLDREYLSKRLADNRRPLDLF
ncbi:hypothetical protein MASR2M78_04910 [Treponema sp.]